MRSSTGYNFDPEVSRMRKLMRYTEADYRTDWETAKALSLLMAVGSNERYLAPLLAGCMNRVLAYYFNNPDLRPFGDPKP